MSKPHVIFLVLASMSILHGCCTNKVLSCPDGRPVTFPKNAKCAQKAYKYVASDFEFNLNATVDILDQMNIGTNNTGFKKTTKELREKLDQVSSNYEDTIKGSFLALSTDPCNNSEKHYALLTALSKENYEYRTLKDNLESSKGMQQAQIEAARAFLFERGKKEGRAMKTVNEKLNGFYTSNTTYPNTLEELKIPETLVILGEKNLEYTKTSNRTYQLIFAGEDYKLHSEDDKVYEGIEGATSKINS
ncbi:hypothetical protein FGF1_03490 [Flavobacteriaceae bacterium GF1]